MIGKPKFVCALSQQKGDCIVTCFIARGYRRAHEWLLEQYEADEIMEPDRGLEDPPDLNEFKRSLRKNKHRYRFEGNYYVAEIIRPVNG